VVGSGGVFLEEGDGVEVEPAELEPEGAAAGGLEFGDGAEGGVDGVHAAIGEEEIGGGNVGVDRGQVPADLGGGVAVEQGFGGGGGEGAVVGEAIFGGAGGEEAAGVLGKSFGAGGELRAGGVGDDGDVAIGEADDLGGAEGLGESIGHACGRDQPEGMGGEV